MATAGANNVGINFDYIPDSVFHLNGIEVVFRILFNILPFDKKLRLSFIWLGQDKVKTRKSAS
jgi:hypothetical protein